LLIGKTFTVFCEEVYCNYTYNKQFVNSSMTYHIHTWTYAYLFTFRMHPEIKSSVTSQFHSTRLSNADQKM